MRVIKNIWSDFERTTAQVQKRIVRCMQKCASKVVNQPHKSFGRSIGPILTTTSEHILLATACAATMKKKTICITAKT